ncbi:Biotin/lipoate A/B protein ligase family [Nesidiocoris tenuis]|uniref:Biotin/lipoate A/B protein ligase family n=1 Tax=Nesidiocoris tenuis TaxID=355587 RepID=A0ABN7AQV0_9HEMI|nr:Biotin/lipoate A/B protein ligase family [Nesidiocoris tenuis]
MAFAINSAMKCTKFTSVLVRQCSGGTLLSGVTKNAATMASSADLRPTAPAGGQNGLSKSVFISQSRDIFTNLALEDWMYKNFDFTDHHIMLLWRNDPCVVIGRHQNPWVETDTELLDRKNVKMARRNSGGGTVYHDPGNLNITFFSPKSRYNRKQNLEILANTLEKQWNLRPEINKKEDLIIDEKYKISGTASKLGRPNAYHHCTLLVNVEKADLKSSLLKNEKLMIKTNATSSVPAPTINLSEIHSGITMDALIAAVGWQYMKTDDLTNEDKGWGQVQKQKGFQMINPSEEWFPGIEKIRDEFASWEWRYGKTPKFEVSRSYDIGWGLMDISMTVESGVIQEVYLVCPDGVSWGGMTGKIPVATSVINQRFSQESFILVERALKTHKFHMSEPSNRRHAAHG